MRYFIVSDIHANLEALTACLLDYLKQYHPSPSTKDKIIASLQGQRIAVDTIRLNTPTGTPDKVICLGDTLGYGANPNECWEMVNSIADVQILGNHELSIYNQGNNGNNPTEHSDHNIIRMWQWTYAALTEPNKKDLQHHCETKPYLLEEKNIMFSHGLPTRPELFFYHYIPSRAQKFFTNPSFAGKISLLGHAHITSIIEKVYPEYNQDLYGMQITPPASGQEYQLVMDLSSYERILVSVPSVGQPRDKYTQTGYALYDSEKKEVLFRRIPYDIAAAAEKTRRVGLPSIGAERLFLGQ